jgi:hypothetical protein
MAILLKGNKLSVSEMGIYKELLVVENDPQKTLCIGHIRIETSDATSLSEVKIDLNGKNYLKDFPLIDGKMTIDFGRAEELETGYKKPIVVSIKKVAAGTGTMTATCFVDGIEKQR